MPFVVQMNTITKNHRGGWSLRSDFYRLLVFLCVLRVLRGSNFVFVLLGALGVLGGSITVLRSLGVLAVQ